MAKRKVRERTEARKKKGAARPASGHGAMARRGEKAVGKKAPAGKKTGKKTKGPRQPRRREEVSGFDIATLPEMGGLGPETGGQSGDTEGLSRAAIADSESVEELLEEGQAFEAGVISGVENAPDADKGGVRTRQVPEDDVPQEYLDED